MKFYKVLEYYREESGSKRPIHYYMILHRSLKTLFRWKWQCTVYTETWFKIIMKRKGDYTLERYIWQNDKWERV